MADQDALHEKLYTTLIRLLAANSVEDAVSEVLAFFPNDISTHELQMKLLSEDHLQTVSIWINEMLNTISNYPDRNSACFRIHSTFTYAIGFMVANCVIDGSELTCDNFDGPDQSADFSSSALSELFALKQNATSTIPKQELRMIADSVLYILFAIMLRRILSCTTSAELHHGGSLLFGLGFHDCTYLGSLSNEGLNWTPYGQYGMPADIDPA